MNKFSQSALKNDRLGNFQYYHNYVSGIIQENQFCEYESLFIDCSESKVISIEAVEVECCGESCGWGATNAKMCKWHDNTPPSMRESNKQSLQSAIEACNGKSHCWLSLMLDPNGAKWCDIPKCEPNIAPSLYQDPCIGHAKRATVVHTCIGIIVFEFSY